MATYISKTYLDTHFGANPTIDAKIEIFRDRVMGWQIEMAEALNQIPHSGYGILSVLFSYFEMIAQYVKGMSSNNRSKDFFVEGFNVVFAGTTLSDSDIKEVYVRVRCGMYHSGYTKVGVLISGQFPNAVDFSNNTVHISPQALTATIREHFTNYIITLKNQSNATERANFEKMFDAGLGI